MRGLAPVLLLGGQETALGVARSLGRRGVRVAVSGEPDGIALRSRFCAQKLVYPQASQAEAYWGDLLLGSDAGRLDGHVVLATCDEAIQFMAKHHAALGRRYRLDMRCPNLQLALLDKQRSLQLAREAGVDVPSFWQVSTLGELERALPEVGYPVLVKPIHSHLFRRVFGRKHLIARDADHLAGNARQALDAGLAFMLCELIPGPDSLLSSYYTYLTPSGEALFHFTKRVVRRYPLNEGGATYHVTQWLPETAAAGERFFRGIGFQGLGNVEFKLDRRDGRLKLIECNARFTAAQSLVTLAGIDTAWISYCGALGMEPPRYGGYRENLVLWNPEADFRAFRELRRAGRLGTAAWLRSILRADITPYSDRTDLLPWFLRVKEPLMQALSVRLPALRWRRAVQRPA